ncbi:AMP-binding protein [bacterium]|nr:AMP-binding protein [bacterium]
MILHHEFIKSAKKYAKKTAIIDRTTDKKFTYSKALIASIIFSKLLKKYEDNYIGVMVPTSGGCFLSILGALMAQKVPVMINYSTGAEQNCLYAQDKIGFKTIITSQALLEKIKCPIVPGMILIEDLLKEVSVSIKLSSALKAMLPFGILKKSFPADPDDNVVILFTSGSEKEPRAVQLTHTNISSNVLDAIEVFNLTEKDAIMAILPLFHVFGQTIDFWLPLVLGATAVTYANPIDYKTVPKIIREEKATMIAATPIFFSGYLRESKPGDFESLNILVAGADKTPDKLRAGYMEKHGKVLLEGYGATETSPVVSVNTLEANKAGSIGPLFPSVKVKIVDINTGKEVSRGEEGKILVKGPNVMKGYYDDIEETSLRIKDGWYDTGDMGILDEDGFLWHKGRLKRFVKIGGEMVSMVRTENVLQQILPETTDCCVVDVPDRVKGAKLIAAVTQDVNTREIIREMSKSLSSIAIPAQFVVFEELPKMGSGKVDFRTITEVIKQKLQT